MSNQADPRGTLATALAHTERLLTSDPVWAAEQAIEILRVVPGEPKAWLYLGAAEGLRGRGDAAMVALERAVRMQPSLAEGWRLLADHRAAAGDVTGADAAYANFLRYSAKDPRLMEAAVHLCEQRLHPAEVILRSYLLEHPTDVSAIRMFAELAARLGRYGDAEKLLERCLELAPSFTGARHNYALVLHRQNKLEPALAEIDRALLGSPNSPGYRNLKAAIQGRLGNYDEAVALFRGVLAEYPSQAKVWMSLGHALKSAGQGEECIASYRKCIELSPQLGEAWWSLANMKTFRFTEADCEIMRAQLATTTLTDEDRFHFHFALAKAAEDAADYEQAFSHYDAGNRQRRAFIEYDADENRDNADRSISLFSKDFIASRRGHGCPAPDPIFIVGLPRSGSTLLEQILASHSQVEGTMELPDIIGIARSLGERKTRSGISKYPEVLADLSADDLRQLGEQYLEQTRVQRKEGAPLFIDKMPNNFAHTGLIHLILPNARIIDARRHPLGCCFSGFKQHFARGQHFSYGLNDIGRYYFDYVRLMTHFDEVLPGRVHRVFYEQMIEDTEGEVRRLLDYCGLPFEEGCLRFYENERAVRTASSEQVRQPIYKDGMEHWRHFEPWLGELKQALGSVLECYPQVPEFPGSAASV